jgi:hypothetical protein
LSDVHFSDDDDLDKKYVHKFVGKEVTKLTRKLAGCYDKIDELKKQNEENLAKFNTITGSLEKYENRMSLCEKAL